MTEVRGGIGNEDQQILFRICARAAGDGNLGGNKILEKEPDTDRLTSQGQKLELIRRSNKAEMRCR